jgi:hypothetical protein
LNEVTDLLLDLLERHILFETSEYLAIKVLNEVSCTIDDDLAIQLETYRTMKKGNIVPNIVFNRDNFSRDYGSDNFPKQLSNIKSESPLLYLAPVSVLNAQKNFRKIRYF